MAVIYLSMNTSMDSCKTIRARITKLNQIIDELMNTALKSVATGNIVEYKIDTGQGVENVIYSSTNSVINAVKGYEALKVLYENQLLGHEFKIINGKNLR